MTFLYLVATSLNARPSRIGAVGWAARVATMIIQTATTIG
jgi:hypothetical protein